VSAHQYFVGLVHLSSRDRRAAALWAVEKFGEDAVRLLQPKEFRDSTGHLRYTPGFWFEHEQDAVLFRLRWG
jgi:hypothetical protein